MFNAATYFQNPTFGDLLLSQGSVFRIELSFACHACPLCHAQMPRRWCPLLVPAHVGALLKVAQAQLYNITITLTPANFLPNDDAALHTFAATAQVRTHC